MGSREAFDKYVDEIFDRKWLTNAGPLVVKLEQELCEFLHVRNCVTMANGTLALEIAIRALGMTGEVIVPSFTFVATAHALNWQGITPVFADIDASTHTLDPDAVRQRITPKTTGIIGVHLWGRGSAVEELQQIADEHGLELMFDAAHAFGVTHEGRMIGGFGRAEAFSFHATKFFNTFEGGMVATNDDDLAREMRLMRNFGFNGPDEVVHLGTNGKMTEICAAMGLVNLDEMESFVAANRRNYAWYASNLAEVPGVRLLAYSESEKSNFQYVVLEIVASEVGLRDQVIEALHERQVLARRYFWPGAHRMEPYRSHFPDAGRVLPNTKLVAERVVVLPTGIEISERDVKMVCRVIADVVATRSA